MQPRPTHIPAHAREILFSAPPMPLHGAESHARILARIEAEHLRSRSMGEHAPTRHASPKSSSHGERYGRPRGESDYTLHPEDRERYLSPPRILGDGSTVCYDAVLTRAGIYEFEGADGETLRILKPPKILEAASWTGVPVLLGPSHPKPDNDPDSPYAFDLADQEARIVGSVIADQYLPKWMLWDGEEDIVLGRLAISKQAGRDYIQEAPYVSTGYRSFIIERPGVWGDGDDEDDKYQYEFVWVDPIHLTITPSPRSGSVTQIRTESKARTKGLPKTQGEARAFLSMGRFVESHAQALRDPYAAALCGLYHIPSPSARAESATPKPAPARGEPQRTPMNESKKSIVKVEGVDLEMDQVAAMRVHDTLKRLESENAAKDGQIAQMQKSVGEAATIRTEAEAKIAAKDAEIATLKADLAKAQGEAKQARAEADAAKTEGPARVRLLRVLGAEAKPEDEALPIHALRLRVVDALGLKASLGEARAKNPEITEAFVEAALAVRGISPNPAPTTPANPAPTSQANANAEALGHAASNPQPQHQSSNWGWA